VGGRRHKGKSQVKSFVILNFIKRAKLKWWPDLESNQGHEDFQFSFKINTLAYSNT